ncbi:hypothetical protein QJQ45_008166 [Haematococcus lacustris]|nr:hypothetical protein QJQ45_008166 [Haematococcus lacustris]
MVLCCVVVYWPGEQIEDLSIQRVDTWIQEFSGATHVLDVYRQKRVDKRKVAGQRRRRAGGRAGGQAGGQAGGRAGGQAGGRAGRAMKLKLCLCTMLWMLIPASQGAARKPHYFLLIESAGCPCPLLLANQVFATNYTRLRHLHVHAHMPTQPQPHDMQQEVPPGRSHPLTRE